MAVRVVEALEVVHVAQHEREAHPALDLADDVGVEGPPVGEACERVVGGLVAQPHGLLGGAVRGHRLIGEQAQRLQARVGREQPVAWVVDPDEADPALAVLERDEQPVARPRVRSVAVKLGPVGDLVDLEPGGRHLTGQQVAARDLELLGEQGAQHLDRRPSLQRRPIERPAGGRHRDEGDVASLGQLDHHLVEAKGVLDAVADRL